jgi:hypothetical protein
MPDEPDYVPVAPPPDRATLEYNFASKDPEEIVRALYTATRHDSDWKWVQGWLLTMLNSEHVQVRWAAATCLGDLAIIHRRVDLDLVVPALLEAATNPETESAANESLLTIKYFVKTQ